MDLTVVIPTHNQAGLLAECLRRLHDQSLDAGTYEILVVDDGSTDETSEVIRRAGSRVRGVRLSDNRGRSAARNAGIEQAAAPLIVFVDSDVLVRRDFLALHLDTHRRRGPGILSRGPVVLVPDVASAGRARIPRVAASPAYLDTANAGVEKEVLRRAGMFDEEFPGYGWEDFELGVRLRRQGIRRVFCPEAVAFHVQPSLNEQAFGDLLRKEQARARSAAYFYRKFPTPETRLLIQATPLHRAAFWLLAAGGLLTIENTPRLVQRLRRRGLDSLAYFVARGALNRHYSHCLAQEFHRHDALLA